MREETELILDAWAAMWGIPTEALKELRGLLGAADSASTDKPDRSEGAVLNSVKAEASRKNMRLWRNNVGGTYTADGAFFRFGLANESKRMNETIKSGDLIGIRPVVITIDMVDTVIGQFVSREIKHAGWTYSGTGREPAQLAWAKHITSLGGDACFATGEGTL